MDRFQSFVTFSVRLLVASLFLVSTACGGGSEGSSGTNDASLLDTSLGGNDSGGNDSGTNQDGGVNSDGGTNSDGGANADSGTNQDSSVGDGSVGDAALADGSLGDGGSGDGSVSDAALGDGSLGDGGFGDGGADGGMVPPPLAPVVTTPMMNDAVFGTIMVTGTGEPDAGVSVSVDKSFMQIGSAFDFIDGSGNFSVMVTYMGASHNDMLDVVVTVSNLGGSSPDTVVSVRHDAPSSIQGNISQSTGDNGGTEVYIRLYTSQNVIDALNYVAEEVITATDGVNLLPTAYSFNVANGTYYLRAFRDSQGPGNTSPDGQPTVNIDAQSGPVMAVVSGATTGINITLNQATGVLHQYSTFNVFSNNESRESRPPSSYNSMTMMEEIGMGECEGYYMALRTEKNSLATNVSPPYVQLPNETVITMLDDGGCDHMVKDNTSMSYDNQPNDNRFSFGIPDPTSAEEGNYTFFYEQTTDGHLHIQVDEIMPLEQMTRRREVTAPTSVTANTDLTPTITWAAVPGATAYDYSLYPSTGGSGGVNGHTTSTSVTISNTLADDTCYRFEIEAHDADSDFSSEDIDSSGRGVAQYFCNDVDGMDTVTISGSIMNLTGMTGDTLIEVETQNGTGQATVRVPSGTSSYAITVLEGDGIPMGSMTGEDRLRASLDVNNTGDPEDGEDNGYYFSLNGQDFSSSQSMVNIVFTPPVEVLTPANKATLPNNMPSFTWKDYNMTAGMGAPSGGFSYAVFVNDESNDDFPITVIAIPSTTLALDLGNLPAPTAHLDVVEMFTCIDDGGMFDWTATGSTSCVGGSATGSQTALAGTSLFDWGIAVTECPWPNITNTAERANFIACIANVLMTQQLYAQSTSREFTTP